MASTDTIIANCAVLQIDNPSDAASFNIMAQGIGLFCDNLLVEFANTQNTILTIINNQRYGKSGYYTSAAEAFQLGDNLTQDALGNPVYAVIDPTKQIIQQAAFQNNSGQLSLKIATADPVSGLLKQLTAAQLAAFQSYFVAFEIPGIPITIVSLPANIFNFNAACTYNAGYDLTTLQANILAALNVYDNTFPFNGILYSDGLSDYIKANVPGIVDFFVYNTTVDGQPFVGSTSLSAGYFNYIMNIFNNINFLPINV